MEFSKDNDNEARSTTSEYDSNSTKVQKVKKVCIIFQKYHLGIILYMQHVDQVIHITRRIACNTTRSTDYYRSSGMGGTYEITSN